MNLNLAVVAHFKNGEIVKGYTRDFSFIRQTFHLSPVTGAVDEPSKSREIVVEDLKAVFFVKHFEGDPSFQTDNSATRPGFGDKVEITFHDREKMVGYTQRYDEKNTRFLLYPADAKSNNEIVAVIRSSVNSVTKVEKPSFIYL